jgi:hypothetical protein
VDICVQPAIAKNSLFRVQLCEECTNPRMTPKSKAGDMEVVIGSNTRIPSTANNPLFLKTLPEQDRKYSLAFSEVECEV